LKKQGYKVVPRRFSNKKKRMFFGCGSTEHLIAACPFENKESNHKHIKKEGKYEGKKNYKRSGEAHIGHEWDSTQETSSDEDEKIATMAVLKASSSPKLLNDI